MEFIRDSDCTPNTPVVLGVQEKPIYGTGVKIKPRVQGRTDSEHFKKIYLPELFPLEDYDLIKVLKFIIRSCGFELAERVQLRDTKSGREYK